MVVQQAMQVKVRRQSASPLRLAVRFQVTHGHGLLSRLNGRADPPPGPIGDADHIDAQELRGGRFVHIGKNGRRLGYSFARLTADLLANVPADRWIDLVPLTEYGIRYLVLPDELSEPTVLLHEDGPAAPTLDESPTRRAATPASEAPASVRAAPARAEAAPRPEPAPAPRPEPATVRAGPPNPSPRAPAAGGPPWQGNTAPVRRSGFGGPKAPGDPTPPAVTAPVNPGARVPVSGKGPVPIASNLADAALRALSREAAVEQLRVEMDKVAGLWARVRELETALRSSQQREADLLEVLARWQKREHR